MTNLNELQYFSVVAQTKSFTVAAARLKLPKSSLSRAIQRLEQRLGVQLLQRTTRSVRLTEAGSLYLAHCHKVVEESELADIAIGAMLATPKGLLRMAVPVAFAKFILEPLMDEFLFAYPELSVHIDLLNDRDRRGDEEYELVVRVGPLEDSGWLVKPLTRVQLGLYASPALLKQYGRPQSPADLQRYSCMVTNCMPLRDAGAYATWCLQRGSETREVRVRARVALADPSLHLQLALKGVGIASA